LQVTPEGQQTSEEAARASTAPVLMPKELFRYIWQISGRTQIWLSLLSVLVFLLTLAPLELQRRIVNGAIDRHDFRSLVLLCVAYAVVALVQGGLKLRLNIDRSAVSEDATRDLRLKARRATAGAQAEDPQPREDGVQVAIVVSEVEPVGGFIGMSVSEPLLHGGILVSVFFYLLCLQPWMALVCLLVFAPQFVFVPLMQATINRRTKTRIKIVREVSTGIVNNGSAAEEETVSFETYAAHADRIYEIDMRIFRLKFTMNFLMNLLRHLAIVGILFVGGWFVVQGRTEIGTVVAFISGLDSINEPWGDLVNYFREMTSARVKYRQISRVLGEDADEVVSPHLERLLGSSD
jgi:ABC-type multidrug transport system fused ATPase/permease subunit